MHLKFWDLTSLKFSSALPNLPNCNSKLKESTTNCDWYQESLHPFGFQPLWSIFYQTPFTNLNLLLKPLFRRKYHTRHITWKLQRLFYTDIWCKQTNKQTINKYTMQYTIYYVIYYIICNILCNILCNIQCISSMVYIWYKSAIFTRQWQ